MDLNEHDEQTLFQTETLRVARQLWPQAEYGGPEIVDGRERDGIFETEECTHLLECTVSRSQDKADKDSKKLVDCRRENVTARHRFRRERRQC